MKRNHLLLGISIIQFTFISALTQDISSLSDRGQNQVEESEYTLSINTIGSGSVSPGSGIYSGFVNLEAHPGDGYKFAGWEHDLGGAISVMPLVMGTDKRVTAIFVPLDAPMHNLSSSMEGSGLILQDHHRAYEGTLVEFYAIPAEGYIFAGWKGDVSGNTNPLDVTIDQEKSIVAQFIPYASTAVYVSPDGDDSNPGTEDMPQYSIQHALGGMNPGNVLYVMPGIYDSGRIRLEDHSGIPGNPIHIVAYDLNNRPVFKSGISITRCSYLHFKGFEITEDDIQIKGVDAHHNVFEWFDVHHVTKSQVAFNMYNLTHDNLMVHCDFHENVLHEGSNADGIAMWGTNNTTDGPFNNTLKNCRSYFNNDDGFDIWWAGSNNRFESCWAYGNGRDPDYNDIEGDGNGFKLGQGKCSAVLINCLAWRNRNTGFDQNANSGGGLTILNCTAFDNTYHDFDFWQHPATSMIRNCISHQGSVNGNAADDTNNSWNESRTTPVDEDFISLDFTPNMGDRKPDGSLPESDFLMLKQGSKLIDAGIDVGLPFRGIAPDLGAYETDTGSLSLVPAGTDHSFNLKNYPNPFAESTIISFHIGSPSTVKISVHDLRGEELCVLENRYKSVGEHMVNWNGQSRFSGPFTSGVYFCKLCNGSETQVTKMIIMDRYRP